MACGGGDDNHLTLPWDKILTESLGPRGPDHQDHFSVIFDDEGFTLHLVASVLHMRGESLSPQPAVDPISGNVLLWNGEIFGGNFHSKNHAASKVPSLSGNDTEAVLAAVEEALNGRELRADDDSCTIAETIRDVLSPLEGPWAMIFYHRATSTLCFGRDRVGRRSLVMLDQESIKRLGGQVMVSSASWAFPPPCTTREEEIEEKRKASSSSIGQPQSQQKLLAWEEVSVNGLWCLDLKAYKMSPLSVPEFTFVPWVSSPLQEPSPSTSSLEEAAQLLLETLSESVRRRVVSAPFPSKGQDMSSSHVDPPARVAVLYSGGIDCQVLAALSHHHLPPEEPLDLVNVCFDDNQQSPDRLAALVGLRELRTRFPQRHFRLIFVNVRFEEVREKEARIKQLILPCYTPMDFNIATAFYFASRGRGLVAPSPSSQQDDNHASSSKVGAATHGGLLRFGDAASSAQAQAKEHGPQIPLDLQAKARPDGLIPCPGAGCLRVLKPGCIHHLCGTCCIRLQRAKEAAAAGGEEKTEGNRIFTSSMTDARNTQNGQKGYLCRVHKLHKGKDKGKNEGVEREGRGAPDVTEEKKDPLSSPLPSAGAEAEFGERYQSQARVVLLGIGADEQLAGYGRHRSTYLARGLAALEAELASDLGRLWKRNLGRDDRVISEHGKEARTPYLDEHVMALIRALAMQQKCCLDEPLGIGDKKILRYLAGNILGLPSSAALVKRAIQFGSRISKQASIQNFGSINAGKQSKWKKKGMLWKC